MPLDAVKLPDRPPRQASPVEDLSLNEIGAVGAAVVVALLDWRNGGAVLAGFNLPVLGAFLVVALLPKK